MRNSLDWVCVANLKSYVTQVSLTRLQLSPSRHVLSQEAVYHSLLETSRRQLHPQIAQVLAEQFPEPAAYQSELLAYHYTQAELCEPALVY